MQFAWDSISEKSPRVQVFQYSDSLRDGIGRGHKRAEGTSWGFLSPGQHMSIKSLIEHPHYN